MGISERWCFDFVKVKEVVEKHFQVEPVLSVGQLVDMENFVCAI